MPKITRSEQEVEVVKDRILQCALDILVEEGFDSLSMHKVGKRMAMTAANLYNYYTNKDELLIAIHKKTFSLLFERLQQAIDGAPSVGQRIESLVRAFVEFGLRHPSYYDIMFNRAIPQHRDYIGTPQEPLSEDEYRSSLKTLDLAVDTIARLIAEHPGSPVSDPRFLTMRTLSLLHGVISLNNSRILAEMVDDPDRYIEQIISDIMLSLKLP